MVLPKLLALLREFKPVLRVGKRCFVTRYDDVRAVLADDGHFAQPYKPRLDVVLDRDPFILGESEPQLFKSDLDALGEIFTADDLEPLGRDVERRAETIVSGAGGTLEIVGGLTRPIAFGYLADYLGVAAPQGDELMLQTWSIRLFDYIFFGGAKPGPDVVSIAAQLRTHIDAEIARAHVGAGDRKDILAQCLARQAAGDARFSDRWVRTQLMGLLIGGPPQPPMVLPQALNQLFKRPEALAGAQAAARAGDEALLFAHVFEAIRFQPLAPAIPRETLDGAVVAPGRSYAKRLPAGIAVLAGIQPAMHDPRRVDEPHRFDADRSANDYLHYGFGVHECFARRINRATLHRFLSPLLRRPGLRRAPGAAGRLTKRGPYAVSMTVLFD